MVCLPSQIYRQIRTFLTMTVLTFYWPQFVLPSIKSVFQCFIFKSIQVTAEQSRQVEASTRDQAACRLWYQQRTGSVTASIFKQAAKTNPAMSSPSLIKRICHPEAYNFFNNATRYSNMHNMPKWNKYAWDYQLPKINFECVFLPIVGVVITRKRQGMHALSKRVLSTQILLLLILGL